MGYMGKYINGKFSMGIYLEICTQLFGNNSIKNFPHDSNYQHSN